MITAFEIVKGVDDYLNDSIQGSELVDLVDDAVATDSVYDYKASIRDVVLRYQNIFADYVSDANLRKEHDAYYGPDKLRLVASEFRAQLANACEELR